jgi:hypothetical protein
MTTEVKKADGAKWRTIFSFIKKLRNEPEHSFMLMPNSENFTGYIIYLDGKPIGFATWNCLQKDPPVNRKFLRMPLDQNKPCLRQFYIIPEERRKGYGTILFLESRKQFTKSQNLYVESPNTGTGQMLAKLKIISPINSEGSYGKNGDNNVWFIYCA